jgi:hypothetical protein
LTIWLVCVVAFGLHAGMQWALAQHARPRGDWRDGLGILGGPYILIALAALVVHRFDFASKVLLVGAFLAAVPDVFLNAAGMPEMIRFLDEQAAGKEVMYCSPPPYLLGLFLAGAVTILCIPIAFLSAVIALMWPSPPRKPAPDPLREHGLEESP